MAQATSPVVLEGEALLVKAQASDGQVHRQEMAGFGSGWSGNAQLFWGAGQPGAQLVLSPMLPAAGLYEVRIVFTAAPDFGIVEVNLAGHGGASFDGYNNSVALREAMLGPLQLAAGAQQLQLRVTGKRGLSTGYFMGIDRIEFIPVAAPVAEPSGLPPWTTQDVIDSRIDVAAQYGLMRMLAGEQEERIAGSNILSAVKDKSLGGIYQEDQQVPALRAQASGYGWWQILPKSTAGAKANSRCMTDPPSKAPIIVMRKKAETNPVAYDKALQDAWYACGLPPAPVRPYAKTLPDKQPAAKTTRCATPLAETFLGVSLEKQAPNNAEKSPVVGAKVVVEGQGAAKSGTSNADGIVTFNLSSGGLYLVTVQGIPGANGSMASNRTVDVLPQCVNTAFFVFSAKPAVGSD